MLKFSLPVIIGGSVLAVGATLGTVAVAMPGVVSVEPAVVASATPEPVSTGSGDWTTPNDVSQREFITGYRRQDLPTGLHATVNGNRVIFSYVGPCLDPQAKFTVWSDVPGQWQSQGSGCMHQKVGEMTYMATSYTWDEYTRNAYCYSPLGAKSAYRAEIFGMYSEWVPIPDQYKVCINGQKPEGAVPPPVVTPAPVTSPTTTAPIAPTPSASSSPSVSAPSAPSPTPTASAIP